MLLGFVQAGGRLGVACWRKRQKAAGVDYPARLVSLGVKRQIVLMHLWFFLLPLHAVDSVAAAASTSAAPASSSPAATAATLSTP